ncbi:MAG: hypothetical protein RL748_1933 [Pseudomonadota bacterium]|jgi:hypothetical protein
MIDLTFHPPTGVLPVEQGTQSQFTSAALEIGQSTHGSVPPPGAK